MAKKKKISNSTLPPLVVPAVTPAVPATNLAQTVQSPVIPDAINTTSSLANSMNPSVPVYGENAPNALQSLANKALGTSYGYNLGLGENNTVGYVDPSTGQQMYTGDLTGNKEAMDYFSVMGNNGSNAGTGLAGMLSNKDLMSGVGTVTGALGSGLAIYDKLWGNGAKTDEARLNLLKQQREANQMSMNQHKNFLSGLEKSGLAASGTSKV